MTNQTEIALLVTMNDNAVYCKKCDNSPCLWLEHKETMIQYASSLYGTTDEEGQELSNGGKRYKMYRQIVLAINEGPMGKGNRMRLPRCVAGYPSTFP